MSDEDFEREAERLRERGEREDFEAEIARLRRRVDDLEAFLRGAAIQFKAMSS